MRQEVINIYKFHELPAESQAKAIERFREGNYQEGFLWSDEALEAIKKGLDAFSCDLRNYSIDWSNPNGSYFAIRGPENAEELTGNRLRTWLINNADTGTLRTAKPYGKYEKRESKRYHEGKETFWRYDRYSKIQKIDSSCPFTGACYDESFLDPIRKFIQKPDSSSLADLMKSACIAVNRDIESEIDYQNSDEGIIETIRANDYEFYINGKIA